ncbi:peptidylprolyl isomerase [Anaerocolumna sp. AGMB13020]|uniref:peptidylprolyl isomerase n=1 Tax=Anaerocolumna sp. AGMB13020 TaxID=3081750 RepID=UPI002952A86B|nr:peptidylprolyl isomerase [Anaerocolumna sp. AGMB13020]WOO34938.1 peptidylprolyl isomerase [Anaerocolumna sp. AGMB13020]
MDGLKLDAQMLLEEVNKAIYAIMVGGQSYKIGSRELTRANLKELKELRTLLRSEVAEGSGGLFDNTVVAEFQWR